MFFLIFTLNSMIDCSNANFLFLYKASNKSDNKTTHYFYNIKLKTNYIVKQPISKNKLWSFLNYTIFLSLTLNILKNFQKTIIIPFYFHSFSYNQFSHFSTLHCLHYLSMIFLNEFPSDTGRCRIQKLAIQNRPVASILEAKHQLATLFALKSHHNCQVQIDPLFNKSRSSQDTWTQNNTRKRGR